LFSFERRGTKKRKVSSKNIRININPFYHSPRTNYSKDFY
jgi:hypothetical protein